MGLRRIARNRPGAITIALAIVVLAWWAGSRWLGVPDIVARLGRSESAIEIYVGFAGLASIVGGFAGVVLVFAMTPDIPRFASMRRAGRRRLQANFASPVSSSLLAAFVAILAACTSAVGYPTAAAWAFIFGTAVAGHAALRLLWILGKLLTGVRRHDDDVAATGEANLKEILAAKPEEAVTDSSEGDLLNP